MVTALYRRYRPDSFQTMIGQSHVTEPLMAALRGGKVGHAYLFSGPRGCGKTTSARILARCLNCAEGPTDTPCGKCESCVELGQGGAGSVDVVEIDAASHGSVDDARDLRARATYSPVRDRYKIFIIDEAHMVTSNGFNALLKIVEEPPAHLKFIFATTEPEKVLGTIRSRTQHYPFRLVAPGVLIDYAEKLLQSENVTVEEGVLPLVARAGGGSVRDSLSVLDQLISGSDGVVRLDTATALLGYTSSAMIDTVVEAIAAGDAAAAFNAVDSVLQTGQDARRFTEDLLQRVRDLIVIGATSVDGASAIFRGTPQDQLVRMFEQQTLFERGVLSGIADVMSKALDEMRGASSPRMQLELMLARVMVQRGAGAVVPAMPIVQNASVSGNVAQDGQAGRNLTQQQAQTPTVAPASQPAPSAPDNHAPAIAAPQKAQEPAVDPISVLRDARAFLAGETPHNTPDTRNDDSAVSRQQDLPAEPVIATVRQAQDNTPTDAADIRSQLQAQMNEIAANPPSQDFLRETSIPDTVAPGISAETKPDAAGTPQTPLHASEQPAVMPAAPSEAGVERPENAGVSTTTSSDAGDIEQVWDDVMQEIFAENPGVFKVVVTAVPLNLDGEILHIGFAIKEDLDTFKQRGAGPLREALEAAIGVTVKYQPRQITPQQRDAHIAKYAGRASGHTQTQTARQDSAGDSEEPHRADPLLARLETISSIAAETEKPVDAATMRAAQSTPMERIAAMVGGADADGENAESADRAPKTDAPENLAGEQAPQALQRYGEAVIRQLLGGKYLRDEPLDANNPASNGGVAQYSGPGEDESLI